MAELPEDLNWVFEDEPAESELLQWFIKWYSLLATEKNMNGDIPASKVWEHAERHGIADHIIPYFTDVIYRMDDGVKQVNKEFKEISNGDVSN